jgi:hypothetical protein
VRHRAARHLAIADLGQPVPGLPVAEIPQARDSDRSREPRACRFNAAVDTAILVRAGHGVAQ